MEYDTWLTQFPRVPDARREGGGHIVAGTDRAQKTK